MMIMHCMNTIGCQKKDISNWQGLLAPRPLGILHVQDDVQSALEELRKAGIKVWMLTGDKVETAVCIARSTKLVDRYCKPLVC